MIITVGVGVGVRPNAIVSKNLGKMMKEKIINYRIYEHIMI